ncbi:MULTISPECIES: MarR family EPS-associated transcriptional regulator [unclassified Thiocapsa]|uniref:MarR family EPS-associated transcriptional regulator n=1 Tax=unclassified Thiocapsa TaxID=2641286 RepID=UPI0035B07C51
MTDELQYRVLKHMEAHPDATQRDLAKALGVSLGSTNFCVRAVIDQGWVKVQNFRRNDNKLAYAYLLTPQGIEAKARITARLPRCSTGRCPDAICSRRSSARTWILDDPRRSA